MGEDKCKRPGNLLQDIKDDITSLNENLGNLQELLMGSMFKGEYDPSLKYPAYVFVLKDGVIYQSLVDNNGDAPPSLNWRTIDEVSVYHGGNATPDAQIVEFGKILINLDNGRAYTKDGDGNVIYLSGCVTVDTIEELESLDGIHKVAIVKDVKGGGFIYNTNNKKWELFFKTSNTIKEKKPMVSFIFDDGFISHWDNAHLFENRGVRCGFAVNKAYTNISGRMSTSQLKDLQSRGFEILNHSFSHIPQTSGIWEQSQQEIEQNYEIFRSAGLDIKGFVTPNSQLSNKDRIKIIRRHHSYAFTEYKGNVAGSEAIYSETDASRTVFDLFRIECSNRDNTIRTLEAIKETNGLTVFYSHNIGNSGAVSIEDLTYYIDYCKANGIEIVTPRVLVKELAKRKAQNYYEPKDVFIKENIYTGHFGFSNPSNVDATHTTDGRKEIITITAGANVGDLILSNIYTDHISSVENQEFVFQFEVNSSVAKNDGLTIGIRVQKASNNIVVYDSESEPVRIDGHTRKYKISTGNITVNEEFYFNLFFRIKGVGADDMVVTVDNPSLIQGNISDIINTEDIVTYYVKIPFDTTTVPTSTRTPVNMVTQDNSLFTVDETKVTFKKSGFYSINARCRCTLDADHNGDRIISRFLVRNYGRLQSDKAVVADIANFDNNIIDYFNAGDELVFDVWQNTGASQTITKDSSYNLLEIIKIN